MRGWRSSHWPSKAEAPPTPIGPTTSGGVPEASLTENAWRAPAYAVWSRTILIFGCVASNALATSLNVFCWLSSSPPPRQQNQVTETGPPGGTVGMPLGAATLGATLAATSLGATLAAVLAAT